MCDSDMLRRGDVLKALQEWTYCCDAEEMVRALPAVQPDAREAALREAATVAKCACIKCGGDGWQWGHELYDPPGDEAPSPDDTRYSCDGGGCKASAAILALIDRPTHVNETPKIEHEAGNMLTPATKGDA